MPLDLVAGWTGPIDFKLEQQLAGTTTWTPIDLTNLTVTLVLRDKTGAEINTAGKVVVPDAVGGAVRYSPASTDLDETKSPYWAHWKAVDAGGKAVYNPSGVADEWRVHRA